MDRSEGYRENPRIYTSETVANFQGKKSPLFLNCQRKNNETKSFRVLDLEAHTVNNFSIFYKQKWMKVQMGKFTGNSSAVPGMLMYYSLSSSFSVSSPLKLIYLLF